jgi:hypothetical protein
MRPPQECPAYNYRPPRRGTPMTAEEKTLMARQLEVLRIWWLCKWCKKGRHPFSECPHATNKRVAEDLPRDSKKGR